MKKLFKALSTCLVLVVMAVMLVGCVPSNVAKAKEKMQEAGYKVGAYTDDDDDDILGGFIAYKDSIIVPDLTAIQFEDNDEAKDYFEEHQNDKLKKNIERKGKWVFWGTESAIKEFK